MTDEQAYVAGRRAAWAEILATAVTEVGPARSVESWRLERRAAVAVLRELCAEFGDNDWDDDLHLADVIEKHLGRRLHTERSP
jgi:hypothetical protein